MQKRGVIAKIIASRAIYFVALVAVFVVVVVIRIREKEFFVMIVETFFNGQREVGRRGAGLLLTWRHHWGEKARELFRDG